MSDRVLSVLGALAAIVVVAAAIGLALAIVDRDDDGAVVRARIVEVDLNAVPVAPATQPPRPDSAATGTPPEFPASSSSPAVAGEPTAGPVFLIAQLRVGARVALWNRPRGDLVKMLGPRTEFGSPVILAVVRRRGRWLGVDSPDMPNGRLGWVRQDPLRVGLYMTRYSLHVDLSGLSLSLRDGKETVARFLVTVGAPGSETPPGRYGITDALRFDESPFYGCCALALSGRQTQLPEDWIGGDRLAIHGTPGPVGGAESHGCIRATDATMRELFRRVPLGTPVFVDE